MGRRFRRAGNPRAVIGFGTEGVNFTTDLLADVNIVLPLHRFHELADEGIVGSVAKYNYSFMGYQGYPPDTTSWEEIYGPQVAARFKAENVDCILLTPA